MATTPQTHHSDAATWTGPVVRGRRLADPDDLPGSDVVVFDGQCNFCRAQIHQLSRLDLGGKRLSYLSLHDDRVGQRYPDLTHDDLMRQMYVVDTQGRRRGGAAAVRYLSRRLPLLWPAMPILHLPGSLPLWSWAYRQVARRRYQLAGKSDPDGCDGGACEIHWKGR